MTIHSVYDEAFRSFGRVVAGLPCGELLSAMETTPMPQSGVSYETSISALEQCAAFSAFSDRLFGGMPTQLGMCWGHNTKLNCLEYHRDSEFNLGTGDFILLLAKMEDVHDMLLDTSRVMAFRVPAGVLVEIYATTLHYAPCHTDPEKGFHVLVALPRGTNTAAPTIPAPEGEDLYLTACNKWLLPHPDSDEAKGGAKVGLTGDNIDIANDL